MGRGEGQAIKKRHEAPFRLLQQATPALGHRSAQGPKRQSNPNSRDRTPLDFAPVPTPLKPSPMPPSP